MDIIWMLLIGLVIGVVAKFLTPGRDPSGCLVTIALGIGGSLLASYLGQKMGWYTVGQPAGFLASVLGAILLLLIFRLLFGRRR